MNEQTSKSRKDELEKMILEAQKIPGLKDLLEVYGGLEEVILKSQEYLYAYKPKTYTTLSNNSA